MLLHASHHSICLSQIKAFSWHSHSHKEALLFGAMLGINCLFPTRSEYRNLLSCALHSFKAIFLNQWGKYAAFPGLPTLKRPLRLNYKPRFDKLHKHSRELCSQKLAPQGLHYCKPETFKILRSSEDFASDTSMGAGIFFSFDRKGDSSL